MFKTGAHRTCPVVTCSAFGALQVTVRLGHERFKRRHVADVGAPVAGAERPVPPKERSVTPIFVQ